MGENHQEGKGLDCDKPPASPTKKNPDKLHDIVAKRADNYGNFRRMTNPHTATPSLSEPSNGSNSEDQNTTLKNLRSSLEGAQVEVKKIRREKNYELKKLEETHHTQLSIALKDQQCRLHKEKVKDWELQKES